TGIGSFLAFFAKRTNTRILSVALGFSAGVMIYVSFVEMFPKAKDSLVIALGPVNGYWVTALSFFAGILCIGVIDALVPSFENPHEIHKTEEMDEVEAAAKFKRLYRMGLFTALVIAIHNFPEGLATFVSALKDTKLGIAIAVAIAIHNIPEGIAVSVPIYYATGNRKKAFAYSFLSGISEPIGAVLGYVLLFQFLTPTLLGIILAVVGGIMVFICFDELLPIAIKYGDEHLMLSGMVSGMVIMALSLFLLGR
ncbi:MAG: zinc transporter ZupT, partial [Deltaproteobacteria bacterium]|nr:zinc transporter ZupT [Deltaproteobacteria bacterium]